MSLFAIHTKHLGCWVRFCLLMSFVWTAQYHLVAAQDQESAEAVLQRAWQAADRGKSKQAVELATAALEKNPDFAEAYYVRGREALRLRKIEQAVEDLDHFAKLRPQAKKQLWERGIACYYAGQLEKGAKQFELYQTYYGNDVENAAWHYLCRARLVGTEKARQQMLPIDRDRRVPMMKIYELYRGRAQPQEVLDATRSGDPPADILAGRLFYAHLYLGLYYEAAGKTEQARHYIDLAAKEQRQLKNVSRYMQDVARVHAESLSR